MRTRNVEGLYFRTFEEAKREILNLIPTNATVGIGNSVTLINMNIANTLLTLPCVSKNKCIDCKSKERVCNNLVIIEGQRDEKRMKVLIVDEEEGF